MNMEKIKTKKELLNILADRIFPNLEMAEKDAREDYKITGKTDKQKKDWKTDELLFDDNGDPIYEDKWEYVEKTPEEMTEDDNAKIAAIEIIRNALEKLI